MLRGADLVFLTPCSYGSRPLTDRSIRQWLGYVMVSNGSDGVFSESKSAPRQMKQSKANSRQSSSSEVKVDSEFGSMFGC